VKKRGSRFLIPLDVCEELLGGGGKSFHNLKERKVPILHDTVEGGVISAHAQGHLGPGGREKRGVANEEAQGGS